jgi:hypothetical protein
MKPFRYLALALLPFLAIIVPSHATPLRFTAPAVEFHPAQVRAVCHHYRWSSRRACTSAKQLMFVTRPPLYYPSRYFADRPHYYYEQRRFYWRSLNDRYRAHYWHHWPYRYGWY